MTTLLNKAQARRRLLAEAADKKLKKSRVSDSALLRLERVLRVECAAIVSEQDRSSRTIR